ncbi:hypothetical protein [Aporhodopirellula aestuarii]|uniref:Uncharacterized protein n=1 Tax=Aporhodopirellula aestuarii TaxID=2950107 RepID=A0ABT0UCT0_9BACT|nr:hypothetical protein [Aporhodopirellula aestuarii]MCM2374612.1 hypothetical protein [Aporhodopirellula aestuarii]
MTARDMIKRDLQSKTLIIIKGGLFFLLGCLSAFVLLSSILSLRNVLMLGLTIWSFCRAYYFAFYVIEHYVDDSFHYSGLIDFAKHWINRVRK